MQCGDTACELTFALLGCRVWYRMSVVLVCAPIGFSIFVRIRCALATRAMSHTRTPTHTASARAHTHYTATDSTKLEDHSSCSQLSNGCKCFFGASKRQYELKLDPTWVCYATPHRAQLCCSSPRSAPQRSPPAHLIVPSETVPPSAHSAAAAVEHVRPVALTFRIDQVLRRLEEKARALEAQLGM